MTRSSNSLDLTKLGTECDGAKGEWEEDYKKYVKRHATTSFLLAARERSLLSSLRMITYCTNSFSSSPLFAGY